MNEEKNLIRDEENMTEVVGGSSLSGRGGEWTRDGMTYYRVAQGDTLSSIAQRFHTSKEEIRALNPMLIRTFDEVNAGCELRIR